MAGGESKLSRLASAPQGVADVRFQPIQTTSQKSIVTREEMDDLIRQFNERLEKMQTAYNALASVVRMRQ